MTPSIRELTLDDSKLMVVKRLVQAMVGILDSPDSHDDTMRLQGFAVTLAICFEEFTGNSANSKKPSELMKWAFELPQPLIRKVH